jgi:hypothetical protein
LAIEFEWNNLDEYFGGYLFDINHNAFNADVLQTSVYFMWWNA